MSTLATHLADYLAMRRALGFKLERPAALLAQFLAYLEQAGAGSITIDHALAWARQPADAHPCWPALRLSAVRQFARYLSTIDPATEVPPADLLPARSPRAVPYLYKNAEITALIDAAGRLSHPLVAANYQTLIGLLAVTGMRAGEAIRLDHDDFDRHDRLLTIRESKFGKSRQLPLHPSSVTALRDYTKIRQRWCPRPAMTALLVSSAGTRLIYKNVHYYFHRLTTTAGLAPRSATCRPRPHDLRHTFAVNTLLGWYRTGADVPAKLPLLSTWLGHVHPGDTYWYLQATPELLALAADRLPPIGQVSR